MKSMFTLKILIQQYVYINVAEITVPGIIIKIKYYVSDIFDQSYYCFKNHNILFNVSVMSLICIIIT